VVAILSRRPRTRAGAIVVPPLEALASIVGSACARRWRMNEDALCALAATLERATCVQLQYDALRPAVGVVEALAGVEPEAS
jgi:hypothetical protein